jgi:hypothetical protein
VLAIGAYVMTISEARVNVVSTEGRTGTRDCSQVSELSNSGGWIRAAASDLLVMSGLQQFWQMGVITKFL